MGSDTAHEQATLAGGCFWCLEAVFKELVGVKNVVSGYTGGSTSDPTYEEVCNGTTGHAEAVQVTYDPGSISYEDLLSVFFAIHNPTTRDREGPDVGSQYRSAVFYHTQDQKHAVQQYIQKLESGDKYDDPIVTEVAPLDTFYPAEDYHQDFYEKHPNQPYCSMQIPPKLEKLRSDFARHLETSTPSG